MNISLSPFAPENLASRDGFGSPVLRQPAHLHAQAESGTYLRNSSRVPRRRPFMKPPYAIGSVPSLSGHAIAYRWRSLPRVRRHRASKSQRSSERVLPWQVTMDQLIFILGEGLQFVFFLILLPPDQLDDNFVCECVFTEKLPRNRGQWVCTLSSHLFWTSHYTFRYIMW